jgi:hypothetical protein
MPTIPRRNRMELMTPVELAVLALMGMVEGMGAHPALTDAVVLLDKARARLADYIDEQKAGATKS